MTRGRRRYWLRRIYKRIQFRQWYRDEIATAISVFQSKRIDVELRRDNERG